MSNGTGFRVLSWNVQGAVPPQGHIERIQNQIAYLEDYGGLPDILLLNEVTTNQRERWRDLLAEIAAELGDSTIPPHQDYSHVNGNLTAIHETSPVSNLERIPASIRYGPWEGADLKDWDTNVPEKILNTKVSLGDTTLELWNVRAVPGSMHGEEKIKILENAYNRIAKGSSMPCILAGDFNTPDRELADGTVIPWRYEDEGEIAERWVEAEMNLLRGLEDKGMVDVFRAQHGYGDLNILDVSHATQTEEPVAVSPAEVQGKRFDHIIASTELNPQECWYDQEGFSCSDHAPLVAEFSL